MKYKLPKLYKGKEWFIEYAVQNPDTGEWKVKKERAGLNKKSLTNKQKTEHAKHAIAQLTGLLKEGLLNPWEEVEPVQVLTVKEALNQALKEKEQFVKPKTYSGYKSSLKYFLEACDALGWSDMDITQFKRRNAINALDYIKASRKISNHRWNIHKGYIGALFALLESSEYIDFNPLDKIPDKKAVRGNTFEPPTDAEQAAIVNHLYNNHKQLFVVAMLVYSTGAREKELLSVKVSDINFNDGFLRIHGENTKVGVYSKDLPLLDEMVELLKEHLQGAKSTDYVFSRDKLYPGPEQMTRRDTLTGMYRRAVIDKKTGIGINRKLYAQKHRGSDDKILADIPLEFLRQMYGHSSQRMTEKYASKLKSKAMEVIKEKSPGIIPK